MTTDATRDEKVSTLRLGTSGRHGTLSWRRRSSGKDAVLAAVAAVVNDTLAHKGVAVTDTTASPTDAAASSEQVRAGNGQAEEPTVAHQSRPRAVRFMTRDASVGANKSTEAAAAAPNARLYSGVIVSDRPRTTSKGWRRVRRHAKWFVPVLAIGLAFKFLQTPLRRNSVRRALTVCEWLEAKVPRRCVAVHDSLRVLRERLRLLQTRVRGRGGATHHLRMQNMEQPIEEPTPLYEPDLASDDRKGDPSRVDPEVATATEHVEPSGYRQCGGIPIRALKPHVTDTLLPTGGAERTPAQLQHQIQRALPADSSLFVLGQPFVVGKGSEAVLPWGNCLSVNMASDAPDLLGDVPRAVRVHRGGEYSLMLSLGILSSEEHEATLKGYDVPAVISVTDGTLSSRTTMFLRKVVHPGASGSMALQGMHTVTLLNECDLTVSVSVPGLALLPSSALAFGPLSSSKTTVIRD